MAEGRRCDELRPGQPESQVGSLKNQKVIGEGEVLDSRKFYERISLDNES